MNIPILIASRNILVFILHLVMVFTHHLFKCLDCVICLMKCYYPKLQVAHNCEPNAGQGRSGDEGFKQLFACNLYAGSMACSLFKIVNDFIIVSLCVYLPYFNC